MAKITISSLEQFDTAWANRFRQIYTSSAKSFENLLDENNIKLPFKFYYEYILPGNLNAVEFEKKLKQIQGHLMIDSKKVTAFFDIDGATVEEIRKLHKTDLITLSNWATEIQSKNKELSDIKLMDGYDRTGFIDGACYGFGPDEIKYYLHKQNRKDKNTDQIPAKTLYIVQLEYLLGGTISYMISPEKLKEILETVKTKKTSFLKGGTGLPKFIPVDHFGREDPTGFLRYYEQQTRGDD
jgi:hypothetical protein